MCEDCDIESQADCNEVRCLVTKNVFNPSKKEDNSLLLTLSGNLPYDHILETIAGYSFSQTKGKRQK